MLLDEQCDPSLYTELLPPEKVVERNSMSPCKITDGLEVDLSICSNNFLPESNLLAEIVNRAFLDLYLRKDRTENIRHIDQAIRWFEHNEPSASVSYRFCIDNIPLSASTIDKINEAICQVKNG